MRSAIVDRLAVGSLRVILEQIGVPTFVVRRDGQVRYANSLGLAQRARDPGALAGQLRAAIAGEGTGAAGSYACTGLEIDGWYVVSGSVVESSDAAVERAGSHYRLTPRHRDVLRLVVGGATNRTVAELLGISERTVEVHLTAIYQRMGVENRASLVARVLRVA